MNELRMSEERFYKVLERMLEFHTHTLEYTKEREENITKIWGSLEKYTLSMYDDFYEMLQSK